MPNHSLGQRRCGTGVQWRLQGSPRSRLGLGWTDHGHAGLGWLAAWGRPLCLPPPRYGPSNMKWAFLYPLVWWGRGGIGPTPLNPMGIGFPLSLPQLRGLPALGRRRGVGPFSLACSALRAMVEAAGPRTLRDLETDSHAVAQGPLLSPGPQSPHGSSNTFFLPPLRGVLHPRGGRMPVAAWAGRSSWIGKGKLRLPATVHPPLQRG